ncbi:AMP-binding protein [Burkholderia vietnamiensis]|uniref:AMP-binding protein n=1 Tax=Burkholderia vietnamiensis TaxID=60552 RepID=UPI00075D08F4|nr:AMP-binding protein [Burkholderia vietnamiensis]KVF81091.1 beta-hydroxyacyl-ACP dehydratase [Burkholderia vietnamiensis]KVF83174.1 beta-hydroxyacyl-ACP dehydratase [Burkholderia vietnamiensis]KVF84423.1 beta-hydroxyacyl-ACP dehydratase [Burkholderia vietnamiensis]KVG04796.1 beta-hydroxyacyl-ACP dehydratase [Burkholderia vietnamiensis]
MPTHPLVFPLVFHSSPDQTIAWRDGAPVSVRTFVADVARVAAVLPAGGHVFNVCRDRYRFAVGLCAALVAGKVSLLPSTHTPEMVRQLASFAPDAFCLHDAPDCTIDLPRFAYPEAAAHAGGDDDDAPCVVPQIDASRLVAYVFTSGSSGTPVPHRKTWGGLVGCVRAAAERLALLDGRAATLIGTVPPQHMYGFESTVLLALIGGLAFSNRQPFYPGDIRDELAALPQPRVLVTSPVHLRALLSAGHALPRAALVLSATAPLSEQLAGEAEAALDAPLVEIYGSTETGQIATRRTSQGAAWQPFPEIRLDVRDALDRSGADAAGDDGGPTVWASGGHVEAPVPMGDALELLGDGRFLLHGRKADLVNIAGKRTSLAYLNHQLNAIAGVVDGVFFMPDEAAPAGAEARREAVTRLVALVVAPTLAAADLQRALRERIDPAFMPRPLVFVDALPRNETGKLPRDALAALVARHVRTGAAAARTHCAPQTRLGFTIAADHPALPGHFPGHPIVPGVVLLDHAIAALGASLNRPLDTWRLASAKFLSPVAPGEPLDLAFEAAANGAIRFTLRAGARDVASAVLAAPPATHDGGQP